MLPDSTSDLSLTALAHLSYTVPVPGGHRQLLDNVFGYVRPGQLTALMGSSGAGKTTLLDVLANRKTIGVIGGERLIAGRAPGKEFQRGTACTFSSSPITAFLVARCERYSRERI